MSQPRSTNLVAGELPDAFSSLYRAADGTSVLVKSALIYNNASTTLHVTLYLVPRPGVPGAQWLSIDVAPGQTTEWEGWHVLEAQGEIVGNAGALGVYAIVSGAELLNV